jgi:nucleotide-binding universal stress UspA family protein
MEQRIVVGIDGSDHSYKAIDHAIDLIRLHGGSLHLLTVYRPIRMPDNTHSMIRPQLHPEPAETQLDGAAQAVVEAAADYARQRGMTEVTAATRHGPPARTIVHFASEMRATCIVMGSRGLGDITGFMLGSVSQKVVHLAECTVVIVK